MASCLYLFKSFVSPAPDELPCKFSPCYFPLSVACSSAFLVFAPCVFLHVPACLTGLLCLLSFLLDASSVLLSDYSFVIKPYFLFL